LAGAGTAPTNSARIYRALEFFATRSRAMGLSAPQTTATGAIAASTGTPLAPVTIQTTSLSGVNPSGAPWRIQDNMVVILEPGTPNQENVRVVPFPVPLPAGVNPATMFQAVTLRPHPASGTGSFTIQIPSLGDRVPGKININTIWDVETLQALCDKQTSNNFGL